MLIKRILNRLYKICYYLYNCKRYGYLSKSASVLELLRIEGKKNIFINDNVIIQKQSWLAAVPFVSGTHCKLEICKGAIIGNFNHIYASGSIVIESDVLTADKVYISDCAHSYQDINVPICKQPLIQLSEVVIGQGAWLGENVCVIGASVGKGSVIGANSVVTKDIPDYCVAVGTPAKVVKKYNIATGLWVKCCSEL